MVYINWAVRQAQEMAAARGGLLPWQVHDADADVADSSTDRSDTFIKISTDRRGKQALLNASLLIKWTDGCGVQYVQRQKPHRDAGADLLRRCFLISNQGAPGTCAVPSIFASLGVQNAALHSMTREWIVGDESWRASAHLTTTPLDQWWRVT